MPIAPGRIDIRDALDKIPEADILYFYLGVTHLPTVICSPLRKDTHPSLGLQYSNKGHIIFKDFATGEKGSLFDLLIKILNVSPNELIENIKANLIDNPSPTVITPLIEASKFKNHRKSLVKEIQVKTREWKPWDKEYWQSYGVSKKFLRFSRTFPISHIFLYREDGSVNSYPAEKYAYAYLENKDNKSTLKIYQPFSTSQKWINKHTSDIWDLWEQLPAKDKYLIITSSRKDAMCIWCNTGIPSVCLQAESYLPKESVINELKERFEKIFILYDNDFGKEINHGREFGKALSNAFKIPQIELPEELGAKDSSDLFKLHGRSVLRKTIYKLIQYEKN